MDYTLTFYFIFDYLSLLGIRDRLPQLYSISFQ